LYKERVEMRLEYGRHFYFNMEKTIVKTKWYKNKKGYIQGRVYYSDGTNKQYKQHRFFIELSIGRNLSPKEDVHHINGIKDDNRLCNLEIIMHNKHTIVTNNQRIYKKGYKMNLTQKERERRRIHLKDVKEKQLIKKATEL